MNFKTTILGATMALPLSLMGQVTQLNLSFQDIKTYQQIGPEEFNFIEGEWQMFLADGFFMLSPCGGGVLPQFVPPSIGCPLGTTGFITAGNSLNNGDIDSDNDGLVDQRGFISVAPIPSPFQFIEPGRRQEVFLRASPISDLPRPLAGGWDDNSITIFYDRVNGPFQELNFTRYSYSLTYGPGEVELERMLSEIVPGSYIFDFPRNPFGLTPAQTRIPFPISVAHPPMVEAFPGRGLIPGIQSFALTNDLRWRDGEFLVDPRVGFRFDWIGLDILDVLPGDITMFSMVDPVTELIVFPPFTADNNMMSPTLISTPSTSVDVGPALYRVGDGPFTARLTYMRNLPTSGIATDNSVRNFEWSVRLVDSYEGFLIEIGNLDPTESKDALPVGITDSDLEPDADYDGDGFTNFTEYALLTSPFDPADSPFIRPTFNALTSRCEYEIPKRPNATPEIRYQAEAPVFDESGAIVDYRVIEEDDPEWRIELDDDNILRLSSREAGSTETCILRPRITQIVL